MDAHRSRLMAVARRCVPALRKRPGVVGLALYGSLAGDPTELTGFSDVDMAVIYDRPLPAHFTEHRLAEGVKLDLLLFHRKTLREIGNRTLDQLARSSWIEELFIKGLMHGGRDTVLFDRGGEIARVKRQLAVWHPGRDVERRKAAAELRETEGVLAQAAAALRARRWKPALHLSSHQLWRLRDVLLELGGTKRIETAASRLDVPVFPRIEAGLRENLTMGPVAAQASWEADRALWAYLLRAVWEPVEDLLRRDGVGNPDLLELVGEHPVFWHGNRVHECGRVKAEAALTLRWSRHELDGGRPYEALEMLSWFMCPRTQTERCRGLAAALKEKGHDVSRFVNRILRGAEFRRFAAEARAADLAAWRFEVSPRRARFFVEGTRRLARLARA
ncbi:MAG: nucleotidyltransferase domain-containing protein [Candidatus Coatesbacteria bacterium]